MALVALDIARDSSYAGGRSFGDVGAYRLLEGTAHFAVAPLSPINEPITDIELAPRDSDGKVQFSSHFAMLRPVDGDRANRRILFDVVNRGNKTTVPDFGGTQRSADPSAPMDPGNGFLMRQGYTVVWCGWQADVPAVPGLMGMRAPEALGPDGPVTGEIMCWFQVNEPTSVQMLSHRGHVPHPPADPTERSAALMVRDHPNGPLEPIGRDKWSFVRVEDERVEPEPCHIHLPSGFEPGRIYQLVYTTRGSKVVGLGFAAVRDAVSFLKYAPIEAGNPCAEDIDHAYAYGSSQSGRFLRHLIHLGINEDEGGRMALDGIISKVAGGTRGDFNLRFGQPSKDLFHINPELFPFTDTDQTDPVTGVNGSLLARMEERHKVPKIMFINTSAEYWRGDAALIHTYLESLTDAPESESVRRYHFAGTQHGSATFPPEEIRPATGDRGQLPFNSVDYGPLLRAALMNMDAWVTREEAPPRSSHPSLDAGTAVESHTLSPKFARLPGVRFPSKTTRLMRLDYGPEAHLGRATKLPPVEGEPYPALVSDVDADGNEVAGIRLPDLAVPVATYTGWNLRHPDIGNPDIFIGFTGGLAGWTLPFPATRAERIAAGDPRLSVEERYSSKEEYLDQVRAAVRSLVDQRYMLAEDLDEVVERASYRYDYILGQGSGDRGVKRPPT